MYRAIFFYLEAEVPFSLPPPKAENAVVALKNLKNNVNLISIV